LWAVALVSLPFVACNVTAPETPITIDGPQFTRIGVPGEYASIQAAHDAASSGDTILLQPGTYHGQITITKAITLASLYVTTGDPAYIGQTILDGDNSAYTISIPSGAEDRPTIEGLTIRNSDDGITPRAKFNLFHCVITDTSDGVDYEDGSGGIVQFCTFELNSDDGIDLDNSVDVVVRDNIIRNNGDDGIEIRMQGHSGPTLDIVISGNRIHGNGEDGIQLIWYDSPTDRFFEISHNLIYDNVDVGIGMMDGSTTTEDFRAASIPERINVFNNTFANNRYGITGGDNTVVLNNIFVGHSMAAVKNVDGSSELAFNLFFGNGVDDSGSNVDAGSSVFEDPLLDAALELPEGSPAVDAGTALYVWQGQTVLDLPGSAYSGAAPDMGAYESPGSSEPPPDPPVLVSPADGATGLVLTPTLSWGGDGDSYAIQVAAEPGFSDIVDQAVVATASYTVATGALGHSADYYWRVNASNANGASDYSTVWAFTTAAATTVPDPPVLVSPADGAADVSPMPTLAWTGTAEDFDVQLASDASFLDLVLVANVASTELPLQSALDYGAAYFWRVRGNNSVGQGPYSATATFTTAAAPDTEAPTAPQNLRLTALASTSVDLAWDASMDNVAVTEYRLYRDGSVAGTATAPATSLSDTGLEPATPYDYHVTAVDGAGNESPASGTLNATTAPAPQPTLHVGGIVMGLRGAGRWNTARATISVVDESGAPVSGAEVVAQWSGLASDLDSGTTSGGEVQFDSDKAARSTSGQFVVTVTEVNAVGFSYDPAGGPSASCIDTGGNLCDVGPPDTDPPSPPGSLTATGAAGRVDLDWEDNATDPDWASFAVYRAGTPGGPYGLVVEGLDISQYTDSGVTAGSTYYYVVTAVDLSGNESGSSNEASATPGEPIALPIHVGGIQVTVVRQGRNHLARAAVSVVDADGTPIPGALVEGDWSWNAANLGSGSQVTGGGGIATLDSPKVKAVGGDVFTFTVRGIVLDGYRYDAAADVVSTGSATVP